MDNFLEIELLIVLLLNGRLLFGFFNRIIEVQVSDTTMLNSNTKVKFIIFLIINYQLNQLPLSNFQ